MTASPHRKSVPFIILIVFLLVLVRFIERITPNPHYGKVYFDIGVVALRKGHSRLAKNSFIKAGEHNPALSESFSSRAEMAQADGNTPEAIDNYLQSVLVDPGFYQANLRLGKLYQEGGYLIRAWAHYMNALRYDRIGGAVNFAPALLCEVGKLFHESGQTHQSRVIIEQLKALKADDDAHSLSEFIGR